MKDTIWTIKPRPNIESAIRSVRLIPTPAGPGVLRQTHTANPTFPSPNTHPAAPARPRGKYGPSTDTLNGSFSHPRSESFTPLPKGSLSGAGRSPGRGAAFLANASPKSSAYVNNLGGSTTAAEQFAPGRDLFL
jgi:hypothetical protein